MKEWRPENHFIVHALTFLKKIFYIKYFDQYTPISNTYALKLLENDKEAYLQKIDECINWSQVKLYLLLIINYK